MLSWDALALVVAAVALGSLVKGMTGIGGPLVAIPVMAALMGVEQAVVTMAIPAIAMNAWLLWRFRSATRQTRDLPALLATGFVGVLVGTWALANLHEDALSIAMAAAIAGYLLLRAARPGFVLGPRLTRALSPAIGLGAGIMQGSTGMSAPLVATYLHGLNLSREAYVLGVTALFFLFGLAQVAAITAIGLYDASRLAGSLLAVVPALALLPVGVRLGKRLSVAAFNRLVLLLLGLLAAKLVIDVVA